MNIFHRCLVLAVAASAACTSSTASAQYTLTTLATFNLSNGGRPSAGLIADANGNLYGTMWSGGSAGTVFKLAAGTNARTTLVNFNSSGSAREAQGTWRRFEQRRPHQSKN
jgi:hypothetical protein